VVQFLIKKILWNHIFQVNKLLRFAGILFFKKSQLDALPPIWKRRLLSVVRLQLIYREASCRQIEWIWVQNPRQKVLWAILKVLMTHVWHWAASRLHTSLTLNFVQIKTKNILDRPTNSVSARMSAKRSVVYRWTTGRYIHTLWIIPRTHKY
jgi:hypothetical protein